MAVLRLIKPFFLVAAVLLGLWSGLAAAQEPSEEEIPLTEQELLELEMEAIPEGEAVPPEEDAQVPTQPSGQPPGIRPPPSRRPPIPRRPDSPLEPVLEPGTGDELVPGTIEVTEVRNVTYFDGQISVEFKRVPAGEALEEIGGLAGFKVVTDEGIKNKPLSVRFSDQPLEKGLTRIIRLLGAGNYRYYYTDEGALETVVVTATSEPISTAPLQRPARVVRPSSPAGSASPPSASRPTTRRRMLRPATR